MEWKTVNLKNASTLIRLAGSFFPDLLIVYLASIPLLGGFFILSALAGYYNYYLFVSLLYLFPAFIWWAYDVFFLSKYGTTPGKRLFKLAVLKENGARLTRGEANKRFLLKFFFGIVLGIGYLYFLFNRKGNTLHNVMTGSYYYYIPVISLDFAKEVEVAPVEG